MSVQYLKFEKTGRFYVSGSLDQQYSNYCFVLHGYGQLASYFIEKFKRPEFKSTLFIAPEGMHRFYLKDSKGRVGASWMTKEDRLNDISDYCNFLDLVYRKVIPQEGESQRVGLFAFSQGVATACRWLAHSDYPFAYMVNWAGAFPPDLDFEKALEKMRTLPLHMVAGTSDEYISEEKLAEHLSSIQKKGFQPELTRFDGGHQIPGETLVEVLKPLISS